MYVFRYRYIKEFHTELVILFKAGQCVEINLIKYSCKINVDVRKSYNSSIYIVKMYFHKRKKVCDCGEKSILRF